MGAAKAKDAAPETKSYTVRSWVQGLREGAPWPAPGEPIELSELDAADYLASGYVIESAPPEVSTPAAAAVTTPAATEVTTPPAAEVTGLTTDKVTTVPKPSGVPSIAAS